MWLAFSMIITLAWPGPAERAEAVEVIQRDKSLQRSLPSAPAKRTPRSAPPRRERSSRVEREVSGGIASVILWILIGVIGVALVAVIGREILQKPAEAGGGGARPDDAVPPPMPLQVAAGTLDDAERLARSGQFAEAIHTLLLRTFENISRQAALPAALTSREILGRVRAADDARAALGQLVSSVEVSIFGGAEPGAADYARCRESFERLLAARGIEVV